MANTKGADKPEMMVPIPADVLQRLSDAIEQLASTRDAREEAELRRLASSGTDEYRRETNEYMRLQTQTLSAIADGLAAQRRPHQRLGLEQQQLALGYDVLRTTLGRPGAASIVSISSHYGDIVISGNLPHDELTLVAFDPNGKELGRFTTRPVNGEVRVAEDGMVGVARLEVRQAGVPILLGLFDPAAAAVTPTID